MNRRGFLGGMLVGLAAPAIIRTPGLLMPIKVATERYSNFIVMGFDQFGNAVTEQFRIADYLTSSYSWSASGNELWSS